MTILEIIPSFFPVGGAETFVSDLSLALHKIEGNRVICVCLYNKSKNDFISKKLIKAGVPVLFIGKRKGIDLACALRLKMLIKKINPDVIHSHLNTIVTLWIAKFKRKIPWVYTFHTTVNVSTYGKVSSLKNLLLRRLIKKRRITPVGISKIVSCSVNNYFGVDCTKTIYNGVDISKYDYSIEPSKRPIDFLFVGRFISLKNPLSIIKAFNKFNANRTNMCKLVMLGNGHDYEECKNYLSENKISNVELKGIVNNPEYYFSRSKILLLASSVEGNPIVINEALASGTFVVSTDVGGIRDVTDKDSAILFKYRKSSLDDDLCLAMWQGLNHANSMLLTEDSLKLLEKRRKSISISEKAFEYQKLFENLRR